MKLKFPEKFKFGATGAAWQMEGEYNKTDEQKHFPHLMYEFFPERWHNGVGPGQASDFYHHFEEDIEKFKEVGITQYRFNIDWSRFIDDYEKVTINDEGAKFYDRVIDKLIECGIEPVICLEHWELPAYYYEKYDGYASKYVVQKFVDYAKLVFERYSDRVKNFYTFNEPIVIPSLCFMDGEWWPYVCDTRRAMQWMHGKILANALTIEEFKKMNSEGKIGIVLNPAVIYPRSEENEYDQKAAKMADTLLWKMFMDATIKGEYPEELLEVLKEKECMFETSKEELDKIKNNVIDILGFNYYQPMRVKAPEHAPSKFKPFNFKEFYDVWEMQGKRMNTSRGWEIFPKALYDVAIRIKEEYGNIEWVVSECGMGIEGEEQFKNDAGEIQDDYRIDFLNEHFYWLHRAIEEGCNCRGFWIFASLDNCSPVNAFKNRYGLIEVEVNNQMRRRIKKSGYWYRHVSDTHIIHWDEVEKK